MHIIPFVCGVVLNLVLKQEGQKNPFAIFWQINY